MPGRAAQATRPYANLPASPTACTARTACHRQRVAETTRRGVTSRRLRGIRVLALAELIVAVAIDAMTICVAAVIGFTGAPCAESRSAIGVRGAVRRAFASANVTAQGVGVTSLGIARATIVASDVASGNARAGGANADRAVRARGTLEARQLAGRDGPKLGSDTVGLLGRTVRVVSAPAAAFELTVGAGWHRDAVGGLAETVQIVETTLALSSVDAQGTRRAAPAAPRDELGSSEPCPATSPRGRLPRLAASVEIARRRNSPFRARARKRGTVQHRVSKLPDTKRASPASTNSLLP
jgi:hypothetical protein